MKNRKLLILCCIISVIAGGCEEALERSLVDKKVVLLAPVNNLVTTDTIHNFYWDQMEGAIDYRLVIVSPRFDSIVRVVEDIELEEFIFDTELEKGSYEWRVQARNNSTVSQFSDTWKLEIQ